MRIAVMAAGAVGGYFGARLAAAGHDVAFIARGAHRDAIRREGLRIESIATRSTPCRSPATKKERCRLHGGASGSGGPCGERNGQYRHGERTKTAIAEQQKFSAFPGRTGAQSKVSFHPPDGCAQFVRWFARKLSIHNLANSPRNASPRPRHPELISSPLRAEARFLTAI
jgi:hypothetical protein